MTRRRWARIVGCVVVALVAWPPSAAVASTASVVTSGGFARLMVTADISDGANDVSISSTGDRQRYLVEDVGTAIAPGLRCVAADTSHVSCDATDVRAIGVTLGQGDDTFTVEDLVYPENPPSGESPLFADGGAGRDILLGGAGRDDLRGGPDDDPMIAGGGGDDDLGGADGADTLDGGPGDERSMAGGSGDDELQGGPGKDVAVTGGPGDDRVEGGTEDDDVKGGVGDDAVAGGPGDDRLDTGAGPGSDAADGRDALSGGPGADLLGAGPTPGPTPVGVRPPQGPDSFSGGDGVDTADFSQRTQPLAIDLDGDADDGEAGEHDDVRPDVENLIAGSNDDTLIGSGAANLLDGRSGADAVEGAGGDDVLLGGTNDASGDNLSGGTGNDTMAGESGDDFLAGGEGDDVGAGGGGGDRLEGDAGRDSLAGGAGADAVDGGAGDDALNGGALTLIGGDLDDVLNGGPGDDRLFGGRGDDRLDGGEGADYLSGESERDTVTYEDRTSRVTVTLDGLADDGEAGEHDNVLPDVEVVLGGLRGDDLSGDADANRAEGGDGEDLIDGGLGLDRLLGGDAPDVIDARDGQPDDVACGPGEDLVIADDRDKAIRCETVDRPRSRRPVAGRYAVLSSRGGFGLRLPRGRRFYPLTDALKIPVGSSVDPGGGVVRLTTATGRAGGRKRATVSGGRFTVRQPGGRHAVTALSLAGRLPDCRRSSTRRTTARRAARSASRKLRVGVHHRRPKGRIEVHGRYSIGGSLGTSWITEDSCDGTLTTVLSGTVRVRDLAQARTVLVRPGRPYLARP